MTQRMAVKVSFSRADNQVQRSKVSANQYKENEAIVKDSRQSRTDGCRSAVKRPGSHLLSDAPCQKLGREDFSLDLFFPDRVYSNRENGFHMSYDNHRAITDSGISLPLWLWQEEQLLPPPSGQMSAGLMTQFAWLIILHGILRVSLTGEGNRVYLSNPSAWNPECIAPYLFTKYLRNDLKVP